MPLNSPAQTFHMANIAVPEGGEDLYLDDAELIAYNADPDGFAARHHGLTTEEYLEWNELIGAPLCAALTKAGKPCKNSVGPVQMPADRWKAAHRQRYCTIHGE